MSAPETPVSQVPNVRARTDLAHSLPNRKNLLSGVGQELTRLGTVLAQHRAQDFNDERNAERARIDAEANEIMGKAMIEAKKAPTASGIEGIYNEHTKSLAELRDKLPEGPEQILFDASVDRRGLSHMVALEIERSGRLKVELHNAHVNKMSRILNDVLVGTSESVQVAKKDIDVAIAEMVGDGKTAQAIGQGIGQEQATKLTQEAYGQVEEAFLIGMLSNGNNDGVLNAIELKSHTKNIEPVAIARYKARAIEARSQATYTQLLEVIDELSADATQREVDAVFGELNPPHKRAITREVSQRRKEERADSGQHAQTEIFRRLLSDNPDLADISKLISEGGWEGGENLTEPARRSLMAAVEARARADALGVSRDDRLQFFLENADTRVKLLAQEQRIRQNLDLTPADRMAALSRNQAALRRYDSNQKQQHDLSGALKQFKAGDGLWTQLSNKDQQYVIERAYVAALRNARAQAASKAVGVGTVLAPGVGGDVDAHSFNMEFLRLGGLPKRILGSLVAQSNSSDPEAAMEAMAQILDILNHEEGFRVIWPSDSATTKAKKRARLAHKIMWDVPPGQTGTSSMASMSHEAAVARANAIMDPLIDQPKEAVSADAWDKALSSSDFDGLLEYSIGPHIGEFAALETWSGNKWIAPDDFRNPGIGRMAAGGVQWIARALPDFGPGNYVSSALPGGGGMYDSISPYVSAESFSPPVQVMFKKRLAIALGNSGMSPEDFDSDRMEVEASAVLDVMKKEGMGASLVNGSHEIMFYPPESVYGQGFDAQGQYKLQPKNFAAMFRVEANMTVWSTLRDNLDPEDKDAAFLIDAITGVFDNINNHEDWVAMRGSAPGPIQRSVTRPLVTPWRGDDPTSMAYMVNVMASATWGDLNNERILDVTNRDAMLEKLNELYGIPKSFGVWSLESISDGRTRADIEILNRSQLDPSGRQTMRIINGELQPVGPTYSLWAVNENGLRHKLFLPGTDITRPSQQMRFSIEDPASIHLNTLADTTIYMNSDQRRQLIVDRENMARLADEKFGLPLD